LPPIAPSSYYGVRANSKATTSLILGIVSVICIVACFPIGAVTGIIAVILGLAAKTEIARSPGVYRGDGYAIAGIITGAIGLSASLLILLFFFFSL
jgi:hypothetical protein